MNAAKEASDQIKEMQRNAQWKEALRAQCTNLQFNANPYKEMQNIWIKSAVREMQCTLQNGKRSSNANPYKAMQINFKQWNFLLIKCNGL